uniref:Uncharacterized protein n=1 Tax=Amphora coffeiformis TaxID=265554 RepID=A0A7S3L8Y7_9STRA|eukprot:scaffold760_cov168-Amphora_coffeaeformis.AAC.2
MVNNNNDTDDDVSSLGRDEYQSDDEEEPAQSQNEKPLKTHPQFRSFNLARASEIILNTVSVVSALQHLKEFECCGKHDGDWLLTHSAHLVVSFMYVGWLSVEWTMLFFSVRNYRRERQNQDENHVVHHMNTQDHVLNWLVCVNPYLGGLQAWNLLYSKHDVLLLWVIEGAALLCLLLAFWWQPNHNPCLWILQCLVPIIPWISACVALWYAFDKGGVCYKDGTFWHEGCELCEGGFPPPCGASQLSQGTHCGPVEEFCFYKY